MKNQKKKGVKGIKKILIVILILLINMPYVHASEYSDITNDVEIRYKWYKEEVGEEGDYYPLKSITPEDKVDNTKITYRNGSDYYSSKFCSLSPEYYQILKKTYRKYNILSNASYILIENINYDNNIKIYSDNKLIDFEIINFNEQNIKIKLSKEYACETLLFYIDSEQDYIISIYSDQNFNNMIISKKIVNNKIAVPDSTWITKTTQFNTISTYNEMKESDFTKLISQQIQCSYQEKYIYKYDVSKKYYDDDYHTYIDGYIKDEKNYKIYYKGTPLNNTIEIITEKIVKVPEIKYVYIEKEIKENDSSKQKENITEKMPNTITKITKEIITKETYIIPKYIYIIIALLSFIIIIIIFIKIYKKYVIKRI